MNKITVYVLGDGANASHVGNKITFSNDRRIVAEVELEESELNGGTIDGMDNRDPNCTIFTVEKK